MKKLIAIIVLCLLPISASALDITKYSTAGGGVHFSNQENNKSGVFGMFVGANIPLYTDTTYGFRALNRTNLLYAGHDDDKRVEALVFWLMIEQNLSESWRFGIGGGLGMEIKGENIDMTGIKLEVGYKLFSNFEVSAGVDHMIPVERRADTYLYAAVRWR